MWFKLKEFRESKKLYQSDMARIMQSNHSSISRNELVFPTTTKKEAVDL